MSKRGRDGQKRAAKVARRRRRSDGIGGTQSADVVPHLTTESADDDAAFDEMFELVRGGVRGAVAETLRDRDPDVARAWYSHLAATDQDAAATPEDEGAGQRLADLVLTATMVQARRVSDDADLVEDVVAWVSDLGESAPAVERLAASLLTTPPDVRAVDACADDLGGDFLPAMVWLVAGAVAVAGEGDMRWFDELDPGEDAD